MGRAAETEKSRRLRVGAEPQILDLLDAGPLKPRGDVAAEIEQGMTVAAGRAEEAFRARILGGKARDEIGTDFVIVLPDHRTERGADLAARGAELLHRSDGRFGDASQRAAPAGMRRADHPRRRIGEQDRAAIGRAHANGEAALRG